MFQSNREVNESDGKQKFRWPGHGCSDVSAMLDEHARLAALLRDAIAATPASDDDYWVGISVDEVVVRGESLESVIAAIDDRGMTVGTVVLEFVSAEPQVIVL